MNINYHCVACGKKYTRKSSYEKHNVLCDYLLKSKREKKITNEETDDIPDYNQLVNIVQQLTIKYSQKELQLANMQKWVEKKKKKINVIQWLNNNTANLNLTDTYLQPFEEWIKDLHVEETHFDLLIENSITITVQCIMEENIIKSNQLNQTNQSNNNIPIQCFAQKTNMFYIYDETNQWRQMLFEDYSKLLKQLQNKLLNALFKWKEKNKDEINNNDSVSILYNRAIIKLMNMNIGVLHDPVSNKIKANLYNYLKLDLKNLIEYDFEF